ncbi:MAG: hypothetical protein IJS47_04120 [Clostridia bacterium]|nr:hypothetical protein [Clostridia bacterium]
MNKLAKLSGIILVVFMLSACGLKKIEKNFVVENAGGTVTKALIQSIILKNAEKYESGDIEGVGYEVLLSKDATNEYQDEGKALIINYVLASYGKYAYVDGELTRLEGSDVVPIIVTVAKGIGDAKGNCDLLNYLEPTDKEIIKLFPEDSVEKALNISDAIKEKILTKEYKDALSKTTKE